MGTYVINLINQKGGVGKTTLSRNLGGELARRGFKVLMVDNDPQGNVTDSFPAMGEQAAAARTSALYTLKKGMSVPDAAGVMENLWLYAGDESLNEAQHEDLGPDSFARVIGRYQASGAVDFIIIDSNPQITNLTFGGIMAATHLILPTTPCKHGVSGVNQTFQTLKEMRKQKASRAKLLGVVFNLFKGTSTQRAYFNEMRRANPDRTFTTLIGNYAAIQDALDARQSVFEFKPNSVAALAMKNFVDEFLKKLGE